MNKEFLGVGWSFPLGVDSGGRVCMSGYENGIRESILVIHGTAFGERVMRPRFGCRIHDYVFSVINSASLALVESAVREAITLWEPRVELEKVDVKTGAAGDGRLDIKIEYKVRGTDSRFNLVYPFYLGGGS